VNLTVKSLVEEDAVARRLSKKIKKHVVLSVH
jgi:hypothetical protein